MLQTIRSQSLRSISASLFLVIGCAAGLIGCGGGDDAVPAGLSRPNSISLAGTVNGLVGSGLVLQNNAGGDLALSANGSFSFAAPVTSGAAYNVTVLTQPSGPAQTCTVANGSGQANASISTLAVTCVTTPPVSVNGTVTGLAGSGLVLQNNAGDDLAVSTSGSFSFATQLASGAAYNVTVLAQPTSPAQTCSVISGSGQATGAPTNVAVNCVTTPLFTVGGTFSGLSGSGLVLRNNGGDNLAVSANGNFTFATALTNGSPYNVTVLTQPHIPAQTCTVTNGSGTINASVSNIAISCVTPVGRFAYVANFADQSVSAYAINASTGGLTPIGSALATGSNAYSVAVDSSGKFAYVANAGNNTVSAYTINITTGALTAVGVYAAGNYPASIAIDVSGKFMYVANYFGNTISMYTINASTGALSSIGTIASGLGPNLITLDPSGKFAYAVNYDANTISAYTVNASTGTLASVGTIPSGVQPAGVVVDPSGKFAYVANAGDNNVSAYSINAITGVLTSIGAFASGNTPQSVVVDSSGKFAYVANTGGNTVSIYTVNASTGTLTSVGTIATGQGPFFVTLDPSGQFAYTTNSGDNTISVYSINANTGGLTLFGTAPAQNFPLEMAITK